MRRLLAGLLALTFLGGMALADGLPTKSRIGAPYSAPVSEDGFNWTGFYIGGGAGYQWYDLNCSGFSCPSEDPSHSDQFFLGDLKAGYDYKFGSGALVLGVFGTWSPEILIGKDGIENIFSLGGRVGFVPPSMQDTMFYVGGAWVRAEVDGIEDFTGDLDGWAVLGGVEKAITKNLTLGLEYKYTDLSQGLPDGIDCDLTGHTAMARLNLRF